ncbi:hypothetical protein Cob_v003983 [Colletotrichum orbiculare MAFF 240422]|uniref:Uncharacterized protein n=1 Tax=Colletotrichum orbiculare (strain 104-T / ATCC 96160 / CBS 514.97 / LARS 414 / MAFF 240422) TaxID=1213857 RepID=A0A484FZU4_COLOR|nr:hypothetical protein Cob_v003983 [Colletotrichum orbiculare MAFF 240422]
MRMDTQSPSETVLVSLEHHSDPYPHPFQLRIPSARLLSLARIASPTSRKLWTGFEQYFSSHPNRSSRESVPTSSALPVLLSKVLPVAASY